MPNQPMLKNGMGNVGMTAKKGNIAALHDPATVPLRVSRQANGDASGLQRGNGIPYMIINTVAKPAKAGNRMWPLPGFV